MKTLHQSKTIISHSAEARPCRPSSVLLTRRYDERLNLDHAHAYAHVHASRTEMGWAVMLLPSQTNVPFHESEVLYTTTVIRPADGNHYFTGLLTSPQPSYRPLACSHADAGSQRHVLTALRALHRIGGRYEQ